MNPERQLWLCLPPVLLRIWRWDLRIHRTGQILNQIYLVLFVIVIYILFVQQTGSFATMRRLTKELQEQRKLATDQEASRLTDVKADFEKKWQIWMEEQKQILSQTEQRLSDRQNKILEAFKGTEDQIAAANKELNASITGTLDTMDDKITKILIANKNPDQQQ